MSCSNCGTRSCTCSTSCSSVVSAVPFYKQADVCLEDNCKKVYQAQYFFSLCPNSSWNVPLCGQTAVLSVPGIQGATVGSYLWHPNYGYFEITSIDAARGQIGVTNNCTDDNASAGTQIPACTCFTITVPPTDLTTLPGVCVAIDFTAPAVDACIDIILTDTTGLTASDTIQIGTGFYFIDAIKPDNIITICNVGDGIIPGTAVVARDVNGGYNYCLSVIASNPCEAEPQLAGVVLGCAEDGTQKPIDVPGDGYVLFGFDSDTNEAHYAPVAAGQPVCTTLTSPLDLVIGDTTYTINVEDTTGITAGDRFRLDNYSTRFDITTVVDATTLDITFVSAPGGDVTYPVGTVICGIGCCEDLQRTIDEDIACDSQMKYYAIPLALYLQPIDLTLSDTDDFQEIIVDASIYQLTLPTSCTNLYNIEAVVSVGVVCNHDAGDVYQEIECVWTPIPGGNPRTYGKIVWVDWGSDGYDITNTFPAWGNTSVLMEQIQIDAPLYPMNYHQNDLTAPIADVAGGTVLDLALNYRVAVGENNFPTTIDSAYIMVSGFIKVFRK